MSAYFVVQATITDEPKYQKYREAVVPFIASFGGKFAARGAKVDVLEGEHDTRSVVMFEFPTMEAIHDFWNSADYAPIKKLREGAATLNVWAFPGVEHHPTAALTKSGHIRRSDTFGDKSDMSAQPMSVVNMELQVSAGPATPRYALIRRG